MKTPSAWRIGSPFTGQFPVKTFAGIASRKSFFRMAAEGAAP
jgi:hypothetical protein